MWSWYGCGTAEVRTVKVRSRYGHGSRSIVAVRSRYSRGSVVVRSLCDHGTVVVRSWYGCGVVTSWYARGVRSLVTRHAQGLFTPAILPIYIVHPESFRSNAQNAIAFAHRNHPRVNRSDRLRAFASTVCNRVRARTCVQSHVRVCDRTYVHVKSI